MKFLSIIVAAAALAVGAQAQNSTITYSAGCPTTTAGDVMVTRSPVPTSAGCGPASAVFSTIAVSGGSRGSSGTGTSGNSTSNSTVVAGSSTPKAFTGAASSFEVPVAIVALVGMGVALL